jgi:hypothetical protein
MLLFSLHERLMKANRYFQIATLGLAMVCIPACVFGAEDISGLLETKRPAAKTIITELSIFREAKLPRLPSSPKQIEFLIDNPHVALVLARLYAPFLDNYSVKVRPDHAVHIEDPGTLAGDAELIDARPGRRVYLIAGYYDILNMRFNGDIVLVTVYSEQKESGAVSVDATVIAYIKINSAFGGALARLADFLFPGKVDERLERLVHAAKNIAAAVHEDPAGVKKKLKASGEISAEELEEFGRIFQDRGSD